MLTQMRKTALGASHYSFLDCLGTRGEDLRSASHNVCNISLVLSLFLRTLNDSHMKSNPIASYISFHLHNPSDIALPLLFQNTSLYILLPSNISPDTICTSSSSCAVTRLVVIWSTLILIQISGRKQGCSVDKGSRSSGCSIDSGPTTKALDLSSLRICQPQWLRSSNHQSHLVPATSASDASRALSQSRNPIVPSCHQIHFTLTTRAMGVGRTIIT